MEVQEKKNIQTQGIQETEMTDVQETTIHLLTQMIQETEVMDVQKTMIHDQNHLFHLLLLLQKTINLLLNQAQKEDQLIISS